MSNSTVLRASFRQNLIESKSILKSKISILAIVLLLGAFVFSFSSCKKTVESFRMLGTWEIENYYVDGVDQTAAFKAYWENYRIEFNLNGDYIETATVLGTDITKAGSWRITNDGDDFVLTDRSDNTVRNFHIIEVKSSTAKMSEGNKEYHLKNV